MEGGQRELGNAMFSKKKKKEKKKNWMRYKEWAVEIFKMAGNIPDKLCVLFFNKN